MVKRTTDELLIDTEASLRLVNRAIEDLGIVGGIVSSEAPAAAPALAETIDPGELVGRGYPELARLIEELRESRGLLANAPSVDGSTAERTPDASELALARGKLEELERRLNLLANLLDPLGPRGS
jgi:hypothetical protein